MTAYVWGLSNKDGKAPVKKAEPAPAPAPASAAASSADASSASAPAQAEKAASAADAKAAAPAEAKPVEKADASSAKVDGKAVFEANCKMCHGGTIPGAPGIGKKDEWLRVSNKVKIPCTNTRSKALNPCLPKAVTQA